MPRPRNSWDLAAIPPERAQALQDPFAVFMPSDGQVGPPRSAMMPGPVAAQIPVPRAHPAGNPGLGTPQGMGGGQRPSNPDEEALAQLKALGTRLADQQRGDGELAKEHLQALEGMPQNVDLSPLLALVDDWTGSSFRGGYKAPESAADRLKAITQAKAGVRQAEQQGLKTEYATIEDQLKQTMQMRKDEANANYMRALANRTGGGGSGGKPIDPAKAFAIKDKIVKSDQGKQIEGILSFNDALNNYERLVRQHGLSPTGTAAAELESAYSKLETAYKEAEKLGALAGPDLAILHGAIQGAGGIRNYIMANAKGGAEGILAAAGQMRVASDNDFNRSLSTLEAMSSGIEDVTAPVLNNFKTRYSKTRGTKAPAKEELDLENMTLEELEAYNASLGG